MRKTEASGWMVQARLARAARLTAVAFGIGLVMTAGPVGAADDDDDDMTFEEKIIDNIMRGVGATNMENRGIDYRERSPLVVPPKLNLPPPGTAETKAPNWPKDPDEARRKAAIAARKKENKDPVQSARTLLPSELNQKTTTRSTGGDSVERPGSAPIMMMPSVSLSSWKSLRQSMKSSPLMGSPPIPMQVDWPMPTLVTCHTAS